MKKYEINFLFVLHLAEMAITDQNSGVRHHMLCFKD